MDFVRHSHVSSFQFDVEIEQDLNLSNLVFEKDENEEEDENGCSSKIDDDGSIRRLQ